MQRRQSNFSKKLRKLTRVKRKFMSSVTMPGITGIRQCKNIWRHRGLFSTFYRRIVPILTLSKGYGSGWRSEWFTMHTMKNLQNSGWLYWVSSQCFPLSHQSPSLGKLSGVEYEINLGLLELQQSKIAALSLRGEHKQNKMSKICLICTMKKKRMGYHSLS